MVDEFKRNPGRPFKSKIREGIVEILYNLKKAHGYEILKVYHAVYGKCAMKSIYYNLKRGSDLGEFELVSIDIKEGHYSWGANVEHVYYRLGPKAKPKRDVDISKKVSDIVDMKKDRKD